MNKHSFFHARLPHFAHRPDQVNSLIGKVKHMFIVWRQNWITRRQLAMLNDEELRDIGMSESQRQEELNKYFWEP